MKLWLKGFAMCQSMFCAIPFPWNVWEEKARRRMLLCLPVVGLEIGLIWFVLVNFCWFFGLHPRFTALVMAAAPCFLTGFLHLDGFMDVTDAVRSWRSLERRREILKDSHVGSFAVIGVAFLLLAQYAAAETALEYADLRGLILIPMVSRCCSVLAILSLPAMETSQYAGVEKKHILLPALMLLTALGLGFWWGVGAALVIGAAAYGLMLLRAYRSLQGMNGDISGYCICLSELAALAALAIL